MMSSRTINGLPSPPRGRAGWPWTEASPPLASDDKLWPKITVVTPSLNQAPFLEETLRSVLLQGYPNLEYLVVDGGSTDGSTDILRRYESHLTWWVSEQDRGQSDALNKGFAKATGAIHAYLNSDDVYEPGALEAVARAFQKGHPWVVGRVRFFDQDTKLSPVPQLPGKRISDWFVCCPVAQPGSFWSAQLHRELGSFREDLHYFMDYDFWLRLRLIKGCKPHALDQPLALYRLHPESKTTSHEKGFASEATALREQYLPYLSVTQRFGVGIARHHRRSRMRGAQALVQFRQGSYGQAAMELIATFASWPFGLIDLGGMWLALKALCGHGRDEILASATSPGWKQRP